MRREEPNDNNSDKNTITTPSILKILDRGKRRVVCKLARHVTDYWYTEDNIRTVPVRRHQQEETPAVMTEVVDTQDGRTYDTRVVRPPPKRQEWTNFPRPEECLGPKWTSKSWHSIRSIRKPKDCPSDEVPVAVQSNLVGSSQHRRISQGSNRLLITQSPLRRSETQVFRPVMLPNKVIRISSH